MGRHRHTNEAELLSRAIALAATAHGGQTDKAGEPYILHPLRVMLACTTPETRLAAVLHDVLEDTLASRDDLIEACMPPAVIEAVEALTRREDEAYFAYIRRLRDNPIAHIVKRADLYDNYMNPDRQKTLRPELRERYEKAWGLLHEPPFATRMRLP